MTETGLNTINLSQVNTFQKALLFILMIGGSHIFVSFFVILIRKRAFESRFSELVEYYKAQRSGSSQTITASPHTRCSFSSSTESLGVNDALSSKRDTTLSKFANWLHFATPGSEAGQSIANLNPSERSLNQSSPFRERSGVGSEAAIIVQESLELKEAKCIVSLKGEKIFPSIEPRTCVTGDEESRCPNDLKQSQSNITRRDGISRPDTPEHNWPYDTIVSPSIGNILSRTVGTVNSSLSCEDRMELGGAEYRAIKLLGYLIPAYFIWQLLGCLTVALHIANSDPDVANLNAINAWYDVPPHL